MARLPALIDLLASFGGAERKTIENQARTLRQAGLLGRSKRGLGAPEVSSADAAILLLATMATDSAAAAPDTVHAYHALRRRESVEPFPDGTAPHALSDLVSASKNPLALLRDLIEHAGTSVSGISAPADQPQLRLMLDRVSKSVTVRITPAGGSGEAWEGNASRSAGTFTWPAGPTDDDPPLMACEVAVPGEAIYRLGRLVLANPAPRPVSREVAKDDVPDDALGMRF